MRLFKRKPEPVPFGDWPLIQDWQIDTPMGSGGAVATLRGHIYGAAGAEEVMEWTRYIRAIRDGLRAAGFDPDVSITREVREEFPA